MLKSIVTTKIAQMQVTQVIIPASSLELRPESLARHGQDPARAPVCSLTRVKFCIVGVGRHKKKL